MTRLWFSIFIIGVMLLLVGMMTAGHNVPLLVVVGGGIAAVIGGVGVNREYFKGA